MVMQKHPADAPVQTCERFASAATGCGWPSRCRCASGRIAWRPLPTMRGAAKAVGEARDAWSNTTGKTAALVTGTPIVRPSRRSGKPPCEAVAVSRCDRPTHYAIGSPRNRLPARRHRPTAPQQPTLPVARRGSRLQRGLACQRLCLRSQTGLRRLPLCAAFAPQCLQHCAQWCVGALRTRTAGHQRIRRLALRKKHQPLRLVPDAQHRHGGAAPCAATNRHWRSRTGADSSCGGDAAAVPWPSDTPTMGRHAAATAHRRYRDLPRSTRPPRPDCRRHPVG